MIGLSEWTTIVTSILATVAAVIVSWRLHQLQQNSKIQELLDLVKLICAENKITNEIADKISEIENLSAMRDRIKDIESRLNSAVGDITHAIDRHQLTLEKLLNSKLKSLLTNARKEFETSVRRELEGFAFRPEDCDQITNEIIEVFIKSTQSLAEVDVESRSENNGIKTELIIKGSLNDVRSAMRDLREMAQIPLLLNAPNINIDKT